MRFQKGQPRHPNSGRKKGSKNKKKVAKVSELLAERDINPVEKILELVPTLEPEDQVKAWMDLLSYCEAKPKAIEVDESANDELDEELKDVETADLLKLLKDSNEAS